MHLYDRLLARAPTAGFTVGRIAALLNAEGPQTALTELDVFRTQNPELSQTFSPYLVTRAHCLWQLGEHNEAKKAARTAVSLTDSKPELMFLTEKFELDQN